MDYSELLDDIFDEFEFKPEEMRLNPEKADWWSLSRHLEDIPIEFIREFKDKIMWGRANTKRVEKFRFDIVKEFGRDIEEEINKYYTLEDSNGKIVKMNWSFQKTIDNNFLLDDLIWDFNE